MLSIFSFLLSSLFLWVLLCCVSLLWTHVAKFPTFCLSAKDFCWGRDTSTGTGYSLDWPTLWPRRNILQHNPESARSKCDPARIHRKPLTLIQCWLQLQGEYPPFILSRKNSNIKWVFVKLVLAVEPSLLLLRRAKVCNELEVRLLR